MNAAGRSATCLLLFGIAGVLAPARAQDLPRYVFDPVHTRVMFEIDHAGFSRAIGTVSGSEGVLLFDADDWSTAQLDVSVPMQRLDMGDSGWAAAVFAPRLLDVKRHPQAHFVATRVERLQGNHGEACGELTLHGVTKPLCMDFVLNRIARYPLPPFRRTAGFSARATLKRSDFGITRWRSLIGDEVELRIEAELFRSDTPAATEPDPTRNPAGDAEPQPVDNH